MWENETAVLTASLKKRILGGKDRAALERIASDEAIPHYIKTLFQKRIDSFLAKELPLSIQPTPHFEIQPKDLEKIRGQILDVFRDSAVFKEKEVEEILREALVYRLDYLVKPFETMKRLLFDDRNEIEITLMEQVLESFRKLLPYAEHIVKECQKEGRSFIDQETYDSTVSKVIGRLILDNPIKITLRDISVLIEYLSETKGEEVSRIEGAMLQEALVDRHLWDFEKAVRVEMKLGKDVFSAADVEMTCKRYLELKEMDSLQADLIVKEKETEKKDSKPRISDLEKPAPVQKTITREEEWLLDRLSGSESLKEEVERPEKESGPVAVFKPKPMKIVRKESPEPEDIEWQMPGPTLTNSSKAPAQPAVPVSEKPKSADVRTAFHEIVDEKTEKVLIKKLFGGEKEAFEQLVARLDQAESWRIAKTLIDNELFKRDVDPFSREAIKLVDIVYSRYYPEEGVGGQG